MARPTLYSDMLDELGREIAAGIHPPDSVLKIELLEQRFDVSRTVVRETVKVLEAIRMVEVKRRVGITVRPLLEWNVFDPRIIRWRLDGPKRSEQLRTLTELRVTIEPAAARRAARSASDAERIALVTLASTLRSTGEAGDLKAFLKNDIDFHRRVLAGTKNEMFAALRDVVAEVLTGRTVHNLMPDHPKSEAIRLHEAVALAIAARDEDAAELAMNELLKEVSEQVEEIDEHAHDEKS